jgi:hypothetical protein
MIYKDGNTSPEKVDLFIKNYDKKNNFKNYPVNRCQIFLLYFKNQWRVTNLLQYAVSTIVTYLF